MRLAPGIPRSRATASVTRSNIEAVIATALEAEFGPGKQLAARLAAASFIAALSTIEETAAARMERDGRGLTAAEIDRLLDDALAFIHAGVAAVASGT